MKGLLKNTFLIALLAVAGFVVSCTEDEEPTATKPSASVSFKVEGQVATSAMPGDTISYAVTANAAGGVNRIVGKVSDGTNTTDLFDVSRLDLNIESGETTADYASFIVPTAAAAGKTWEFWFVVVDEIGTSSDTVSFEVEIDAVPINEFETVLIGGFKSAAYGSSYDAMTDSVYFVSGITADVANQAKIDFIYYFSDASQRTIASPDNVEAEATWKAQSAAAWPFPNTENSTKFQETTLTTAQFDAITAGTEIAAAYSEVATGLSRVTDLAVDNVVAFKLAEARGGKMGLFKVKAVDGNSSGTITIDVKIEK